VTFGFMGLAASRLLFLSLTCLLRSMYL
jgi:hypothetical protein